MTLTRVCTDGRTDHLRLTDRKTCEPKPLAKSCFAVGGLGSILFTGIVCGTKWVIIEIHPPRAWLPLIQEAYPFAWKSSRKSMRYILFPQGSKFLIKTYLHWALETIDIAYIRLPGALECSNVHEPGDWALRHAHFAHACWQSIWYHCLI